MGSIDVDSQEIWYTVLTAGVPWLRLKLNMLNYALASLFNRFSAGKEKHNLSILCVITSFFNHKQVQLYEKHFAAYYGFPHMNIHMQLILDVIHL
jgi:hypothetical protein